jgi:hypothetical protein
MMPNLLNHFLLWPGSGATIVASRALASFAIAFVVGLLPVGVTELMWRQGSKRSKF